MFGAITVGVIAIVVGAQIDQYLAGLVVYALAAVTGFGIFAYVRTHDSLAMGDEREAQLERRASHITVQLVAYLGLFVFITLFLLDATGRPSIGPTVETLLQGFTGLFLTWGAVYLWLRYRP